MKILPQKIKLKLTCGLEACSICEWYDEGPSFHPAPTSSKRRCLCTSQIWQFATDTSAVCLFCIIIQFFLKNQFCIHINFKKLVAPQAFYGKIVEVLWLTTPPAPPSLPSSASEPLITYLLIIFLTFGYTPTAHGTLVPQPGSIPCPLHWKAES